MQCNRTESETQFKKSRFLASAIDLQASNSVTFYSIGHYRVFASSFLASRTFHLLMGLRLPAYQNQYTDQQGLGLRGSDALCLEASISFCNSIPNYLPNLKSTNHSLSRPFINHVHQAQTNPQNKIGLSPCHW